MKRLLFIVLAAAAALSVSCSKDDVADSANEGVVTFSAQWAGGGFSTRAMGDGTTATTLSYAVYEAGETTPLIVSEDKDRFSNLQAKIALRLAVGKTYDILFWADAEDSPYTVDFATQTVAVDYEGALSNDEKRDAFFHAEMGLKVEGPVNKAIELKRPFAQLNIGTNDTQEAAATGVAAAKTQVKIKAYGSLNLATGVAADLTDVTYDFAALPTDPSKFAVEGKGEYDYLAMNYVLVNEDSELLDCTFTVNDASDAAIRTMSVTSVPVQRNYRTNIFGALLTHEADFDVLINPGFEEPDHDRESGEGIVGTSAPGQLSKLLEGKPEVKELKIYGPLNSTDLEYIKNNYILPNDKEHVMETLDLSEASFTKLARYDLSRDDNKNTTLKTIILPEGLEEIDWYAFAQMKGLTTVNIPSTVKSIGMRAFANTAITEIVIPEGVTVIADMCFFGCKQLASITIPETVTSIGYQPFYNTAVTELVVPGAVESFGESPFYYMNELASLTINAAALTEIPEDMCDGNDKLASVTLQNADKLVKIGSDAFSGCPLTAIDFLGNVTEIGTRAFSGAAITELELPASLKTIASNAFSWHKIFTVTCMAVEPPTVTVSSISASNCVLKVPAGSVSAYEGNEAWNGHFKSIEAVE